MLARATKTRKCCRVVRPSRRHAPEASEPFDAFALGAARAWHFQKPTGPGLLSKRPAGRAGPTGLHLYYRLADRQSSRLVTFDSKTASNEVLGHLEPYGVPGDYVSNYFLAWPL